MVAVVLVAAPTAHHHHHPPPPTTTTTTTHQMAAEYDVVCLVRGERVSVAVYSDSTVADLRVGFVKVRVRVRVRSITDLGGGDTGGGGYSGGGDGCCSPPFEPCITFLPQHL